MRRIEGKNVQNYAGGEKRVNAPLCEGSSNAPGLTACGQIGVVFACGTHCRSLQKP